MSWEALRDAIGLTLRPITAWPGAKPRRTSFDRSPYSAGLNDTLGILKRELRELRARGVVLQIDMREADFRLDGLPRAGAVARHPGIVLLFECRYGPLRFYFDRFGRWEHNLRAVTMHLADLRHAGLYGVGSDGQQYTGWKALPVPSEAPGPLRTAEEAADWLAAVLFGTDGERLTGRSLFLSDPVRAADAYRSAARKLHPDAGGGHEEFVRLQEAREILERHHGGGDA